MMQRLILAFHFTKRQTCYILKLDKLQANNYVFLYIFYQPVQNETQCHFPLNIACSRLSDSGEDAKVKGTQKVGGAGKKEKEPPLLSPVSSCFILFTRFLNSAGPTISEPGTGYFKYCTKILSLLSFCFSYWCQ